MENSYGKLILTVQDGPEQEFELGKSSISIGRALTNDVVLNDGRVSRSHARLDFGQKSCTLSDLGSSNGTRLNGKIVDRAELRPGDFINLGNTTLRFEAAKSAEDIGLTVIDTEAELNTSIDQEVLPMAINETSTPRLVIFTNENTWEISLDDSDKVTIGRTEPNQIVLEHSKVSRQHAEVVRKGNNFVLRDLDSTNGTWFGDERVTEMFLEDGDSFRIGQAQLVFKSGFTGESLTMAEESLAGVPIRSPVIFVPGTMGSELWLGNERIWPNVKIMFKNPDLFRFPSSLQIEPRAILDQVVIVPNLIKIDQYNRLGDYLVEELGYTRGKDFFEFPYDWRQDVRISASQLGKLIESLPGNQKVTIIAHSLGTMVSRYYIERLGGKERVGRIMLMGGPHRGSVKIMTSLLIAPEVLPFGLMGEKMRQVIATFPSTYQIIPTYPCAVDQNGVKINFLEDESWLDEKYIPLLRSGREFRREIGKTISVPALSIFGYGLKTSTSISLHRDKDKRLSNITYKSELNGDSTILEKSAVLDGTDIHPVQQYHGSLFVDNDVKMRLKIELARMLSF
jgi:pSer/pThr/pTyr-binding forkhead associated (FHA) protein